MISAAFAEGFAADWIDAWNRHDVDALLAHCADDIELTVPRLQGGRLRGKRAVAAWWARALTPPSLTMTPRQHLEAAATLVGVDSVVLVYRAGGPPRAQTFRFDPNGRVRHTAIHPLAPRVPDPVHVIHRS
jgi:ketosteroid isomerase-like protein